jgi:AraC-like DNA-binding protein
MEIVRNEHGATGIVYAERESDSQYIDLVTYGWTEHAGTSIRPAEPRWHLVISKHEGRTHAIFAGPCLSSGITRYGSDAEVLWVQFKIGTYIPQLPVRTLVDSTLIFPEANSRAFWLNGSAWEFPTHENIETFVSRLARDGALAHDRVVDETIRGHRAIVPERTTRHRFLQTTGQTQTRIFQIERAKQAAAMLRQGTPILDTVYALGYADQPHLTRALKQWIGYTPGQLPRTSQP